MKATIYYNQIKAGILEKTKNEFNFQYVQTYLDSKYPPISFSFPKKKSPFYSPVLFPFFTGLLSEGFNKEIQCKTLKIDENDDFSRLLKTANIDTIGAVTVEEYE